MTIGIGSIGAFGLAMAFDFSFAWITQGFIYGAERTAGQMANRGVNNLPALLRQQFEWSASNQLVMTDLFGGAFSLSIGQLLTVFYALAMVACAVALARHTRRNDARALAAMAAPWMIFFALMPQLSGRYFVWGAASTSLLVGLGFGPMLLHLLISFCAAATVLHVLIAYSGNGSWWPMAGRILEDATPGAAWLTLAMTAVVLFLACSGTNRPVRSSESPRSVSASETGKDRS